MNFVPLVTAVSLFFLLGVIFMVAPTLRPRLAFGCTVAEDFASSPAGRRILRAYRLAQLGLLVVLLAAFFVLRIFTGIAPQWSTLALVLSYVIVASGIWVGAYYRTRPHAVRIPLVRTAPLVVDRRIEIAHLAALLPLAFASLVLVLTWSRIPVRFPIHWGATGVPNHWVQRSPASVFSPLLIAALLIAALWLALRYASPGVTRIRWILPAVAWYAAVIAEVTSMLPLRTHPDRLPVALLFAAPAMTLLICVIVVAASVRGPRSQSEGDGTPDERWIGGIFYYNPQDRALWVEKRMGIGWTLNFARPASWLLLGGVVVFALIVVTVTSLARH